MKVFYSWQSDTPGKVGRRFVRDALEAAIAGLDLEDAERPEIDQDTKGVLGAPVIADVIFQKIKAATVVVADVTLTGQTPIGKRSCNSNVAIELGYALGIHGDGVLIKVMNTHYGPPRDLPFDLAHRRWPVQFALPPDADGAQCRKVRDELAKELRQILEQYIAANRPATPIELSMRYKAHTRSQELHEYRLLVSIANRGTKRITEWQADVEIPRPLLTKDQARLGEANRSTKQRTVRRFTEKTDGHLLPGDTKTLEIRYQVNDHVFEKENHVLDGTIRAQLFVHDQLVSTIEKPAREMQEF